MAKVLKMLTDMQDSYNKTMVEKRDRRIDGWFLMDGPAPTLIIIGCYIYFVKSIGPKLMKNRPPFEFTRLLFFYNMTLVFFSFYLFYEAVLVWSTYSLVCQPVDYSFERQAIRLARACYWYYLSKFVEMADTIFFVLRKKQNQISALHVVHHSIMPIATWVGVRFVPGGHSTFFGMLNCFVHVWMYAYYTIAAMGPKYEKYLWWKRYLTVLQIVQFVMISIHSFQLAFVQCDYPRTMAYIMGVQALIFIYMFSSFYRKTYYNKKSNSEKFNYTNGSNGYTDGNQLSNGDTRHGTAKKIE